MYLQNTCKGNKINLCTAGNQGRPKEIIEKKKFKRIVSQRHDGNQKKSEKGTYQLLEKLACV